MVFLGLVTWHNALGALIGFHLSLLPPLVIHRKTIIPRLLAPVSARIFLPVVITGLAGGLGIWLGWSHAGLPADFSARVAALGLAGWAWLPFIAYFTMVNPWMEEAYWRDALTSHSPYPALVDFLFAGYHLIILNSFVTPIWMFYAFVILVGASWQWRQVLRYTGSLLPAVFSHMLADLSILLVLYSKS